MLPKMDGEEVLSYEMGRGVCDCQRLLCQHKTNCAEGEHSCTFLSPAGKHSNIPSQTVEIREWTEWGLETH